MKLKQAAPMGAFFMTSLSQVKVNTSQKNSDLEWTELTNFLFRSGKAIDLSDSDTAT